MLAVILIISNVNTSEFVQLLPCMVWLLSSVSSADSSPLLIGADTMVSFAYIIVIPSRFAIVLCHCVLLV